MDEFYLKIRNSVIKTIQKKYRDIPKRIHDTPTSSTSGDLFIDEISWLTIKKMLRHFFPKCPKCKQPLKTIVGCACNCNYPK